MGFTNEHSEDGITERHFELSVAGSRVPGVLWTPEGARGARPLLLVGYGGGQHKQAPPVVGRAKRYTKLGYAVVATDVPDHGARASSADLRNEPFEATMRRAAAVLPEWRAALDAVQALEPVGAGPVGYVGLSMGALLGIPFVAEEPCIKAAVFGVVGARGDAHPLIQAAKRITIPLELVMQWDDEGVPREDAFSLFEAFGSREKSLHANPGGHLDVPVFERASQEAFFLRHLGTVDGTAIRLS